MHGCRPSPRPAASRPHRARPHSSAPRMFVQRVARRGLQSSPLQVVRVSHRCVRLGVRVLRLAPMLLEVSLQLPAQAHGLARPVTEPAARPAYV